MTALALGPRPLRRPSSTRAGTSCSRRAAAARASSPRRRALSLVVYLPIVAVARWIVRTTSFQPVHLALMFGSGMIHTVVLPAARPRLSQRRRPLDRLSARARHRARCSPSWSRSCCWASGPAPTAHRGRGADRRLGAAAHRQPVRVAQERGAPRGGLRAAHRLHDRGLHHLGQGERGDLAHPAAALRLGLQRVPRAACCCRYAHRRAPGAMAKAWRERRGTVVAIALLSPLSYILVLTAMVFTPVSLVAPGARGLDPLRRAHGRAPPARGRSQRRRIVAAVGMVLGISGLALG